MSGITTTHFDTGGDDHLGAVGAPPTLQGAYARGSPFSGGIERGDIEGGGTGEVSIQRGRCVVLDLVVLVCGGRFIFPF